MDSLTIFLVPRNSSVLPCCVLCSSWWALFTHPFPVFIVFCPANDESGWMACTPTLVCASFHWCIYAVRVRAHPCRCPLVDTQQHWQPRQLLVAYFLAYTQWYILVHSGGYSLHLSISGSPFEHGMVDFVNWLTFILISFKWVKRCIIILLD